MNQVTETTVQTERQYATLFTEMKALLSLKDKPNNKHLKGNVDAIFFAIYLHIKGKDWKKCVDLTSKYKIKNMYYKFTMNYWAHNQHLSRKLSTQASLEYKQVLSILAKEITDIYKISL